MVKLVGGVVPFYDKVVQKLQFRIEIRHIGFDERIHECRHEVISPKFFHVYAAVLPIRNDGPRYVQNYVGLFDRVSA